MNSERWERIQALFEEALVQPSEERSAFIECACGTDVELRDELVSLLGIRLRPDSLKTHEQADRIHELPRRWLGTLARPRPHRFAAGDRIAGRYFVHRLLGKGGMGEVYEAWDEELAIPVALKTLHFAARTDEALKSLKLEGLLARAVWHSNVCRVYDLGRHIEGQETMWFLTMELLRGDTLAQRLRKEGRIPPDRAIAIAEQVAAGLEAAHRAGVVHRDFKTSNVMLVANDGDSEQAVLTDFGTARAASRTALEESGEQASRVIIGTPAYMAPEQVRGEEVGPAADIYALGIVLYEMVTGILPFTGDSALEVARRRLEEEAPSPRNIVPELDERWEATILRCLAREPRLRFGRAEEVIEALTGRAPIESEARDRSIRAQHTLPAEPDSFVGREMEIKELDRSLSRDSRLVTLLGAGGMGKSRLAVHYGWQSLADWPGGVWFCDLTEARNLHGIASAVAVSLGVQLERGDPLLQLGYAIAGRGRCLMILDNFDLIVDHAERTLERWLEQAAEARFVVTSRERLNVSSETVQVIEPLSIEMGTELFVTRTAGLRPGLELAGSETELAREIVLLVDGMPLAIELAGARMRVMSPPQIVAQMRKRFQLLTGGRSARHETLEMTIDGSWELLSPPEKVAWAQCSVFEGGFTLEAAEGVIDLRAWPDAPWVVDLVQSLIDKSLLRSWTSAPGNSDSAPEARFGMYVSLQDYARMKLREKGVASGERGLDAERVAEERHGKWYAQYGSEERIEALGRRGGVQKQCQIERELANLLAACRRAVAREDGEVTLGVFRAACQVLLLRGPYGKAVELGREVLEALLGCGDRSRAHVLRILGHAQRRCGQMDEAHAHLEAALILTREVGDRRNEALVLDNLGNLYREQRRMEEARAQFEAALAINQELLNRAGEGIVLGNLGLLHWQQDRMEDARAHYEASLAIHREVGNRRSEGAILGNLGILHYQQGRTEEARALYETSLAIHREMGARGGEGGVLGNLGLLDFGQGRMEEARAHQEAALAIHREVGERRGEAMVLGNLGNLRREQGQIEEARALYEAALAIHRQMGNRHGEGIVLDNIGHLHYDQGRIEEARAHYEAALAVYRETRDRSSEGVVLGKMAKLNLDQGRMQDAQDALTHGEELLREVGDRLEFAKLLCVRAELEHRTGDIAASDATLGEAETLAAQLGASTHSLARQLTRCRQVLLQNVGKWGSQDSRD